MSGKEERGGGALYIPLSLPLLLYKLPVKTFSYETDEKSAL